MEWMRHRTVQMACTDLADDAFSTLDLIEEDFDSKIWNDPADAPCTLSRVAGDAKLEQSEVTIH